MIVNYLDQQAGHYEDAVICLSKAIQALKRDNPNSPVCELFERAQRPDSRFDVVFDLRSKKELETIDKGAGNAEAVTGLFFAKAPFFVAPETHGPEGVFLLGRLNAVAIGELRNRRVQVVIVLNSTVIQTNKEKGLQSLGKAMQVLAHEWCVHGVKYLQCADMFLKSNVSNTEIETYLREGFSEASTSEEMLKSKMGCLSPLCHHLRFGMSMDEDYEALSKKIITLHMSLGMSVTDKDFYQERDSEDKMLYMSSLNSHFKFLQSKQAAPPRGFNRFNT